ncbi:hypothetical protein TSTA_065110 [Talaromyces stipitatus ATCC 10500]|uniref:HTH CENPB-type domain-containing protein n=1 Tax=Talaromyces stipitatus (strain ATCC 10500 / CBS 375.48 / QM 6759 / NRRL 1006) TaxID=441959 RepID=B8LTH3_TALSN|nr:uncharacterized protein TSTA_065110 [Talaromyces stipitatus ATCC 10500]EED23051.1 hypothetical protein TSTA_065110 [Talaromyces stipitatus ATCC 10500]
MLMKHIFNIQIKKKIKKLAREFDAPYRRLLARVNGQSALSDRPATNHILTNDQERAVKEWIDHLDPLDAPPTNRMIVGCANAILQSANPYKNAVYGWPKIGYIDFSSDYSPRTNELKKNRLTPSGLMQRTLGSYKLGWIVLKFKFLLSRLHLQIFGTLTRPDLALNKAKKNPAGNVVPPLVIIAGKNHLEEWYHHLPEEDYIVAFSEKGFLNADLIYEWLHNFDISTRQYARNDDIAFQAYKHYHGLAVNNQARAGGYDFDKYDFLFHLPAVRKQTFTTRDIRAGFRDVGIHPYNPEIVMNKLNASEVIDAVPILKIFDGNEQDIPSSPTTKPTSPPLDTRKIGRCVKKIEKDLNGMREQIKDISPNLERRVRRAMKGSLINARLHAQMKQQVNQLLDVNRRSVRDANTEIEDRKAREIEERGRILERAEKRRIEAAKKMAQPLADPPDLFTFLEECNEPDAPAAETRFYYLDSIP